MPISTCAKSNWSNNAQFTFPALGPKKVKALMVYVLALELKALGGTDYTNANTLAVAAKDLQPFTSNRLNAALLGVFIRNANAVTASTASTNPSTLMAGGGQRFVAQGDRTLDQELLFLLCQLGKNTGT
jgi:hypothetical protein